MLDTSNLLQHPYGVIYPEASESEFQDFCADIQKYGFRKSTIILYEGKVLDGWHRYQAALTLDRVSDLTFEDFTGESPLDFVNSVNAHRRHLTPSQRAVIVVKHSKWLERGRPQKNSPSGTFISTKEMAKTAGVGETTVKRAKKALTIAPKKADDMIDGKITPAAIIEKHRKEKVKSQEPVYSDFPSTQYDIIYADPPWNYKGQRQITTGGIDTGGADSHYPTLTLKQLKMLDVPSISAENALLFLWTTGAHLDQAIELGRAWGFAYKTVAFVWDKQRTNPGHYTLSQCEFVLVFKRGSRPEDRDLTQRQFVSALRGGHSEKPLEVNDRIMAMYPSAKRIDLFARKECEGWDTWGYEVKNGRLS